MKINFYLKEPKASESLILVAISLNGKRAKYSTQQKIGCKHWNRNNMRAKPSMANSFNLNKILNTIESKILSLYTKNFVEFDKSNSERFFREIKSFLTGKFENSENDLTVDKTLEKFIELKRSSFKEGTIKAYTTLRNHLKSFSSTTQRSDLSFDDLDLSFFDGFINYLKIDCKQKSNTRSKQIKNMKAFLKFTYDRHYHKNRIFEMLTREHEKGQFVDFREEDFDKVLNVDLSNDINLDISRRLFCISCLTGLRYSDVSLINYEQIIDGKYHFRNIKKNTPEIIPMSDRAILYIKEFHNLYGVGKSFTNQTINKHLTKILIKAEVNKVTLINQKNYKGDIEAIKKPLYQWITFHYGRRFFIIECLKKGLDPLEIMQITGHEDFSVFQGYVKYASEDTARKLSDAW
ncbi:tyrosine-type recombinase/integrase [Epilithonimonas zeae]|uniref:tyrosine-type recombinase/integrase n=1 Tax=Epilithonimonas zeae TaxID=1416779 RepID=UPI00200F392E|nr:phage integrase SAM-like domain-containing protein [Epilithonimonas zeae]UQB69462.1 phage integrase SAM-like domain-containing protein [Epilithonimonas zeae]